MIVKPPGGGEDRWPIETLPAFCHLGGRQTFLDARVMGALRSRRLADGYPKVKPASPPEVATKRAASVVEFCRDITRSGESRPVPAFTHSCETGLPSARQ